MTVATTACVCPAAGWCPTHRRTMSVARHRQCRDEPGYFAAFAKGPAAGTAVATPPRPRLLTPLDLPCRHRAEPLGVMACVPCRSGGRDGADVYACRLHGRCTMHNVEAKRGEPEATACVTCDDRDTPTPSLLPGAEVYAINLDRRPDRWERFAANAAAVAWPLPEVRRLSASDGRAIAPPPPWWNAGHGAWGCRDSHVRILRDCLARGVETVVVFEDDALFPPGFAGRLRSFLAAVPDDWEMLFLGGQHQAPGRVVRPGVLRATNAQRTHAMIFRREGMRKVLAWWEDFEAWRERPKEHIDHRLGWLQLAGGVVAYAPAPWIVGQAANKSDIDGRRHGDRWWQPSASYAGPVKYLAVVGTGRSGSSALAGVLSKLGVWMGPHLGGFEPTGGHEDRDLAKLCESLYPFPSTERQPAKGLPHLVANYVAARRAEAAARGTIAGGKYPSLAALGRELRAAVPDGLAVIRCVRPLDESIASLRTRVKTPESVASFGPVTDEQCETLQRFLADRVDAFCASVPPAWRRDVAYADLIADPRAVIARLTRFLRINPTPEQIEAAVAHVRPELARHSTDGSDAPPTPPGDIHPHGYWLRPDERDHRFDASLAAAVASLLRERGAHDLWDLGCGPGRYVRVFLGEGIAARGVDGNPHTPAMAGDLADVADLTTRLNLYPRDAVVSLEVGEHIPAGLSGAYLDNVARLARGLVVLSWAVPGQGGEGHVHERSNAWVRSEMERRGWRHLPAESTRLRRASRLPWFRSTLMAFGR